MSLSSDIVSQFVKITNDTTSNDASKSTTVYGTIKTYNGSKYVQLDGSDLLTPISTTTDSEDGDRVTVTIANHTATVTGNITSPSATTNTTTSLGTKISEFEIVVADKVSTKDLEATNANITNLVAENAIIRDTLTAVNADIDNLEADNVTINETLIANKAKIENLEATKLSADIADLTYATIENLDATNADIYNLKSTYGDFVVLTTKQFEATDAKIENLETTKLSAESAELKYANIDFANIGDAAIENFFSKSGIIGDLVVNEGTVTGTLVGVTIKGDLIEGGTVVADKLVIQGEDGLYYKLNTNGETISTEQTEYNSLNGSIITAKSVTAEKVSVTDLVAFGATIGGFSITDNAIYSGVKSSATNTTRGVYMDNEGQFSAGDSDNYVKYYKDQNGNYRLDVSAQSVTFGSSSKNLETALAETIVSSVEEFYQSTSPITLTGGSWSTEQPTWTEGTYIWRRTAVTYGDGSSEYTPSATGVCITGNTGATGADGKDGVDGEDGVGVKSSEVTYQSSTSGTTIPTGTWSTTIPSVDAGSYLWTKTVITYTDNTSTISYSVGKMGNTGATGATGADGEDGRGIISTDISYQVGSSQTTAPTGEWVSSVPITSTSLPYLWTRTIITYTDDTTSTSYSVSSTLDSVEIGGRNLLRKNYVHPYSESTNNSLDASNYVSSGTVTYTRSAVENLGFYITNYEVYESSTDYVIHLKAKDLNSVITSTYLHSITPNNTSTSKVFFDGVQVGTVNQTLSTDMTDGDYHDFLVYFTTTDEITTETYDGIILQFMKSSAVAIEVELTSLKWEKGTKATDWTPAPEDVDNAIIDTDSMANEALSIAEENTARITEANYYISQLREAITSIVEGYNSSSMLIQNEDGWTFSMSDQSILDDTKAALDALRDSDISTEETMTAMDSLITSVREKTDCITFGKDDNGNPSIILSKTDSLFQLHITNKGIEFKYGSQVPAYITTDSDDNNDPDSKLYIEKAEIMESLQQGDFFWKSRENGNLGLQWRG